MKINEETLQVYILEEVIAYLINRKEDGKDILYGLEYDPQQTKQLDGGFNTNRRRE